MELESAKARLNVKLTQLELSVKKTASILEKCNEESIERQLNALKVITSEVDQRKRKVEELQIAEKTEVDEITQYGASVDEKIDAADIEVTRIKRWLQEKEAEKDTTEKKGKMQFEMELHKLKLEAQSTSAQKNDKNVEQGNFVDAKLPKIEITRFDGSPLDWPRFWGQFTETVDKRSVAPVNKFAYLCGFLSPKVKTAIEGLPFTPEGYNRAKSILEDRYGKNSEVIKAYIKLIIDLPTINQLNLKKIHQFNDQLMHAVQALQTLSKLETVNGYVPMTLDKLQAIRGDLVRTDPDWEEWDFAKLSEALRLWTRRNPIVEANEGEGNKSLKQDRSSRRLFFSKSPERTCAYCDGGTTRRFHATKSLTSNVAKRF
ncbi:uncharacterized protein LOC114515863 [Dendronephthya gigantea]|uniref:uncharacterized protein LOC114515863 n=1 Tax=Dendronephthya gigantea TaxID=151771 RepID=UPI0010697DBB|nr:uncharacterized protein LOC114515863 [Dendronephthya gigantea]